MKGFNEGDKVTVFWMDGSELSGIIQYIPSDVGDSWHIIGEEGNLHAINPNCSNLEQIVRLKEVK